MTASANHEQLPFTPDGAAAPRFLLRNVADINRMFIHLATHWRQPRVEFRVDGLHVVHSQRAQDRFVRLAGACNCLLGEMLAALTLLGGSLMVWASDGSWRDMAPVVVATLCAALVGKGLELGWTRAKLLLVLRGLRRRLGTAEGSPERDYIRKAVAPAAGEPSGPTLLVEDLDAARSKRKQRPLSPDGPSRPLVLLRGTADINRLFRRLATHWKVPRIEIHVDALPKLDVQRAQTRIVQLSGGCTYMLAAVLAAVILLVGLFYVVLTESQAWLHSEGEDWWLSKLDWGDVKWVVAATLCAALVGSVLEAIWLRVRLMLVLRGLRQRLTT